MSRVIAHFSRRYHFSASHRLHVEALSEEVNRATFGKCNNPFGHGHNYVVEVTLSGPVDAVTGMVVNLSDLDLFAQREVLDLFDHANLNTLEAFRDRVTTTENVCVEMWSIFSRFAESKDYPQVRLERIRIEETGNNSFEYFGEGAAVR
ncbi:6-carboxytetrahydropterin synthase [Granulicella sp. L46]|uniref:6-carboxytetrahydropterin synthase n=1 Tax=Granulicella sp. L46 TaxID=1641865 RepID=UPI00131D5EAE|nr:6-carboxytetrahydropterin synthase [Granulicella sp. L46]